MTVAERAAIVCGVFAVAWIAYVALTYGWKFVELWVFWAAAVIGFWLLSLLALNWIGKGRNR